MDESTLSPHVLIFPFPAQGHVNSMLKLAELLCIGRVHVTFLMSIDMHERLVRYTDVESRFKSYPGFKFETLPQALYEDNPHTADRLVTLHDSLKAIAAPFLKELLDREDRSHDGTRRPPVTCIIADGILSFAIDIAEELRVSIIYFRTVSACSFWAYFCIPELIKAEELPFRGCDMDTPVLNVKGMESFLRRRDLPSLCNTSDLSNTSFTMISTETQQTPRAQGLILNTFEDLEGPILSQIRTRCPNIYTIGPLHAHLKSRSSASSSSNSLWEEDRNCIQWLDEQPPKSVIYVSFGSITVLTRNQLLEFYHGLVNSGKRFLWVIRPESIIDQDESSEFPIEVSKERGYMVNWAPQEEVLAHPAIGAFLTHSGWNSTLESIVEGVPMICWPYFADQQLNSRFVGEVWKLGIDIKDTSDRHTVETVVREVMEVRRDEFQDKANKMAELARACISEGGSSSLNLDRLIQHIRSTTTPL